MMFSALYFVSFIVIATARDNAAIYAGRIIGGICIGASTLLAFVYVGEVSDPKRRGSLGSILILFLTTGILYVLTLGKFLSWQVTCLACAAPQVLFFALLSYVPDSPYFLVRKKGEEEAKKALAWFHDNDDVLVEKVIGDIKAYGEAVDDISQSGLGGLCRGGSIRLTVIVAFLFAITRFSGISPISFYLVDIFTRAKITLDPEIAAILIGFAECMGAAITVFVVDKLGRRVMLIGSGIAIAFSNAITAISFYFIERGDEAAELHMLPLIGIFGFFVSFSLGFGCVPTIVLGESFPQNTKPWAVSIVNVLSWSCNIFIAKSFFSLSAVIGIHGVFWLYAGSAVVGALFVAVFIPETKNKTLAEIQTMVNKDLPPPSLTVPPTSDTDITVKLTSSSPP